MSNELTPELSAWVERKNENPSMQELKPLIDELVKLVAEGRVSVVDNFLVRLSASPLQLQVINAVVNTSVRAALLDLLINRRLETKLGESNVKGN